MQVASMQQFHRLAQTSETILLRNTQPGIAVYHNPKLEVEAIFEAKGDLGGGDIREMPASALADPNLRSCIQRGIYELVEASAPEVAEAVEAMVSDWRARTHQREDAAATLVRQSDRVIERARLCIAPSGRELCSIPVTGSEESAPLCSQHLNMLNQYVATTDATGKTIWQRRAA